MNGLNEINRIVNRHKARLLTNLEAAGCPQIFRSAVASEIDWMRSDLNEIERAGERNESNENSGNR